MGMARAKTKTNPFEQYRQTLEAKQQELLDSYQRDMAAGNEQPDDGIQDLADKAASAYSKELNFSLSDAERPASFDLALGAGMGFAIYSYLGYYNVCYLGGEVRDPARTIPRSILLSAATVVVLFVLVHLALTGVVPWREARVEPAKANLTAEFMTRCHGQCPSSAMKHFVNTRLRGIPPSRPM